MSYSNAPNECVCDDPLGLYYCLVHDHIAHSGPCSAVPPPVDWRERAKVAEARVGKCRIALLAAQAFLETDGQEGAWLRTIETVRDALKEPIE